MKRKQVLVRMSVETYDRLQGLSEKYGLSASELIVSMVNDRWLAEKPGEVKEEIFRVDPVRYDREDLDVEAEKMGVPEEVVKKPVGKVGSAGLVQSGARKRHKRK
jgi:hypothetical protein